ncbi:hypothetical protein [Burkholderia gladioli]|uniref:hypothetical protein n=1 Tax=Burkholderia gladioli TaxID=28095 RepID=UPI00164225D0|nr:hypothetical protein [Burkholderia gladioli]
MAILLLPFKAYFAALSKLRTLSRDEKTTKAIFDFFRNLATVIAFSAAGGWLVRHSFSGPWLQRCTRFVGGSLVMVTAFALNMLLLYHVERLLEDAGVSRRAAMTTIVAVCVFGVLGLLDYLTSH